MKTYYFNVADCIFSIRLNPTDWPELEKRVEKELLAYLRNFQINIIPKKIHLKINFVLEKQIHYLYINNNTETYTRLYQKIKEGEIACSYRIGMGLFQILLQIMLSRLLEGNGLLLHASASLIHKRAYLFLADSGGGKSTIVRFLRNAFPALADDSVIIRNKRNRFYLYQTPFVEKESWIQRSNKRYRLGGVFFLQKAKKTSAIRIIDKNKVLKHFTRLLHIYFEKRLISHQVKIIVQLVNSSEKFYVFQFEKKIEQIMKTLDCV